MRVRVLFFGMLRDLVGRPSEECEFPAGASLRDRFRRVRGPASARPRTGAQHRSCAESGVCGAFDMRRRRRRSGLPAARQRRRGGDPLEIVENGHYFALTRHAIDTRAVIARIQTGGDGAVVTFEGVVRNNTKGRPTLYLDYECYESMALKMIAKIGCEIAGVARGDRIAMVHRLGRMLDRRGQRRRDRHRAAPPGRRSKPRWKGSTG